MDFNFKGRFNCGNLVCKVFKAIVILTVICHPQEAQCQQDFIPERTCGVLYSQTTFSGDNFTLSDFDQSGDLKRDYRSSRFGWPPSKTASFRVESGCAIKVCNETYFEGNCVDLNEGDFIASQLISSVKCTCSRVCSCSDYQNTTISRNSEYGRAYFTEEGCNACNSEYIKLGSFSASLSPETSSKVRSIVLREGCTFQGYSKVLWLGNMVEYSYSFVDEISAPVRSYRIQCNSTTETLDDELPQAGENVQLSNNGLQVLDLPESSNDLIELVRNNDSLRAHPGINAALQSLQNARSGKGAYIIVIGNPVHLHNQILNGKLGICTRSHNISVGIRECRFNLYLNDLGISNAELTIISMKLFPTEPDNLYYRRLASLDNYLSTHPDLKNVLPTLVILQGKQRAITDLPAKQTKENLDALNLFKNRILDPKYSNLIVTQHYQSSSDKYPDAQVQTQVLRNLESIIQENYTSLYYHSASLRPQFIVTADYLGDLSSVNGYLKMPNGEYFPKNFHDIMNVITDDVPAERDPLGHAIIKWSMSHEAYENVTRNYDIVSIDHPKVEEYINKLSYNFNWEEKFPEFKESQQNLKNELTLLDTVRSSVGTLALAAVHDFEAKLNETRAAQDEVNGILETSVLENHADIRELLQVLDEFNATLQSKDRVIEGLESSVNETINLQHNFLLDIIKLNNVTMGNVMEMLGQVNGTVMGNHGEIGKLSENMKKNEEAFVEHVKEYEGDMESIARSLDVIVRQSSNSYNSKLDDY